MFFESSETHFDLITSKIRAKLNVSLNFGHLRWYCGKFSKNRKNCIGFRTLCIFLFQKSNLATFVRGRGGLHVVNTMLCLVLLMFCLVLNQSENGKYNLIWVNWSTTRSKLSVCASAWERLASRTAGRLIAVAFPVHTNFYIHIWCL